MKLEQLKPEHAKRLALQGSQVMMAPFLSNPRYFPDLIESGPAYAGFDGDLMLGCMGIIVQWGEVGLAWGLIANQAGPYLTSITRTVRKFLAESPLERIETQVHCDFEQGHRWARLLGFELETERMRKKGPGGEDLAGYVIVRD